jgi:hypothetical protein
MNAVTHIPAKTKLELALQKYENKLTEYGATPSDSQLGHLQREQQYIENLAQITQRLEEYQGFVESPQYNLLNEDEHQSQRLGENMRALGRFKPTERYDAHAIVSGTHVRAALARIKLAQVRIGLDEPDNGVWLPRSGKDAYKSNCWATPGAVPHSRTHRKTYYAWVARELTPLATNHQVKERLRLIGHRLETGEIPADILEEMKYEYLQSC